MKSNNSNFTGIMLLVLLFLTYQILTAPSKEEIEARKLAEQAQFDKINEQDSLNKNASSPEQIKLDSILNDSSLTASEKDSARVIFNNKSLNSKFGEFTPAVTGKQGIVTLENEKLKIHFNKKGREGGALPPHIQRHGEGEGGGSNTTTHPKIW